MEFKPIKSKSGNLQGAGYEDGKMQVRFKSGLVYEYEGVNQKEWQDFEKTFASEDTSTGSHFAKHFKMRKFNKI
jgi:hypothetical protein